MKEFYSVLLKSNEERLVKSYMESHELTIEFMREVIKSQYCDLFLEFVYGRMYNQQVPADVVETSTEVEKVDAETEVVAPAGDDKPLSFADIFFKLIDVKKLFREGVSSDVEKALANVKANLQKNGIYFWGQLFIESGEANLRKSLPVAGGLFEIFSVNIHREFGLKIGEVIPGLEAVLTPIVEEYIQNKREEQMAKERSLDSETNISWFYSNKTTPQNFRLSRKESNNLTRAVNKFSNWTLLDLASGSDDAVKSEINNEVQYNLFKRYVAHVIKARNLLANNPRAIEINKGFVGKVIEEYNLLQCAK